MPAFLCDRCNKYFTNNNNLKHKPNYIIKWYKSEEKDYFKLDLCDKCYEELEQWFDILPF